MKTKQILLISAIILFVLSCKNKQKENSTNQTSVELNNHIDSISVLYYNYLIEPTTAINPQNIQLNIPDFDKDKNGVLDATIKDSTKIENIKTRIDSLKPTTQALPLDARLTATIHYKDGRKSQLCLGGQYVNEIFLNGIQQETDNQLLFMLKNYIGFYPWLIGDDMFEMKELQDNTFPKSPFFSSSYYQDYQNALNKK